MYLSCSAGHLAVIFEIRVVSLDTFSIEDHIFLTITTAEFIIGMFVNGYMGLLRRKRSPQLTTSSPI